MDKAKRARGSGDVGDGRGESAAAGTGFAVRRERLLRDIGTRGRETGIEVVCAPRGFGKSGLLLQYLNEVLADPARGSARLIDATGLDAPALDREIAAVATDLGQGALPLVVIDNLPVMGVERAAAFAECLRALRDRGFEVLVACTPTNRALLQAIGDSMRIGAQALRVQPREYSEWSRAFSIPRGLDLYDLTQGIPGLVILLQAATGECGAEELVAVGAAGLYRAVIRELGAVRDPLHRLACLFAFMGHGDVGELERCGLRVRDDQLARLARDYPVFGYEPDARSFRCMGEGSAALDELLVDIARRRPALAAKAGRILLRVHRVDDAVRLAEVLFDEEQTFELIGQAPAAFALCGHAGFVRRALAGPLAERAVAADVNLLLAAYLAALSQGEYRAARPFAGEIARRAAVIEREVDASDWACALGMRRIWGTCRGLDLPELSDAYLQKGRCGPAGLLEAHDRIYRLLVEGDGAVPNIPEEPGGTWDGNELFLPALLLLFDRLLDRALHGGGASAQRDSEDMRRAAERLEERRLGPVAVQARMIAAVCRLMAGLPFTDERAFSDAGTQAVRTSDTGTQLFCMAAEGWQSLALGQVANAQFRGQQVLKLAGEHQVFLNAWATLLECAASLQNTARVRIREEAEFIDLARRDCRPEEAWQVALHLSAARLDAELSAWFSLHKREMLRERFRPLARLALSLMSTRADPIRRLLPPDAAADLVPGAPEEAPRSDSLFEVVPGGLDDAPSVEVGQMSICLFGGFRLERNGHPLTDAVWRRKKACILAARLVLGIDSFVSRAALMEELWPEAEYARARENLYVTLSALRRSLGQGPNGPYYVLTQGEGVAFNGDLVTSDTRRFDRLARRILLKRAGVSTQEIIDACLKLEQIYTAPLYVPGLGGVEIFRRMRQTYAARFVDCMVRGIDLAAEAGDLPSAQWLAEAVLKQAPAREDVIRRVMHVFDLGGRRREAVELYLGHLHYLQRELHTLPEDETRILYEDIASRMQSVMIM